MQLWQRFGTALFWLAWPAFWVYSPHRSRTRVLLMYEDKVLVVKNFVSTGRWGLPGGGLHRGEDPRKGALREVFEETGVKLESSQLVYLFDRRTREAGIDVPNKFYYAELLNMSTPHKQWLEIIDAKWLPLKEFDKRNSDAALRLAIAAKENRR